MLVFSRKSQEEIEIGDDVTISILKISRNKVVLGIEAPKDVKIIRSELDQYKTNLYEEKTIKKSKGIA